MSIIIVFIVLFLLVFIFYLLMRYLSNSNTAQPIPDNKVNGGWVNDSTTLPCQFYTFSSELGPLPTLNPRQLAELSPSTNLLPCLPDDTIFARETSRTCNSSCISFNGEIKTKGEKEIFYENCQIEKCPGEVSLISLSYGNNLCLTSSLQVMECDITNPSQLFIIRTEGILTQIKSRETGQCLTANSTEVIEENICGIERSGFGLTFSQCNNNQWASIPFVMFETENVNWQQLVFLQNNFSQKVLNNEALAKIQNMNSIFVTDAGGVLLFERGGNSEQCMLGRSTSQYFSLNQFRVNNGKPICRNGSPRDCISIPN